MEYQRAAPARADALQQSWTENAEIFLTRCTAGDYSAVSLPTGVLRNENLKTNIIEKYC